MQRLSRFAHLPRTATGTPLSHDPAYDVGQLFAKTIPQGEYCGTQICRNIVPRPQTWYGCG
jgi:hypothetical protein